MRWRMAAMKGEGIWVNPDSRVVSGPQLNLGTTIEKQKMPQFLLLPLLNSG